jgi:hypothetical protein
MSKDKSIRGFMCRIDWDHELGRAADGNRVYPSVKALEEHHGCVLECGIVEVEVRLVRVVAEGTEG